MSNPSITTNTFTIDTGMRQQKLKKFDCGIHDLTYQAIRAGCPACEADRDVTAMRHALEDTRNKLALLTEQNHQMRIQIDIVAAMREATEILDDHDMAFLKTVLYTWRDTKSLGLKTTHGSRKGKREVPAANGFIVMPREGDPYGHLLTSMGGLAIADYFDEATRTVGPAKAMEFLVKGMSAHLPGAIG